jgi:FAD/FMN-containing dehydrogenase
MGSCKSVGLSGFALGGGFGFLSRKHGLGVDNIVSLNVVLANGEIVKADAQTNSELFWALRGGGGSFGIVTSMEYRVHQVPPVVTTFYKSFSLSEAKRIVPIWFEWVKNMPPEFVTIMNFNGGNGGGSLTIVGQYLGSANELLSTNLPNWGIPMEPWLRERSYLEAVNYFNGGEETGVSRHFRARSDYYLKPLNNAGIDGIVNLLQATGNPWSYAFLFDSYGAAINNVSQNATAFAHRQNILCSMQLYMSWGDTTVGPHPQDNNSAIRVKAIGEMLRQTGNVSGRAYPNYADATRSDWQTAYYGENLGRLKAAKAQFDSENYFRFEQSIKA